MSPAPAGTSAFSIFASEAPEETVFCSVSSTYISKSEFVVVFPESPS